MIENFTLQSNKSIFLLDYNIIQVCINIHKIILALLLYQRSKRK